MRVMRTIVVVVLALKLALVGAWWWNVAGPAYAAHDGGEAPASVLPPDLLDRSRGFRDLLDAVRQRGVDLDQREQAVAAREAALKSIEKTVADEVTRLEGLAKGGAPAPTAAAAPGAAGAAAAPAAAPGVTKVYESMKAEEAAPILDKLDDATALGILGRMKERQIGALLAAMSRDRAVELTKALSNLGIRH